MKRIVVLAIVGALILGLGYIGFSPQASAAPGALPPQAPQGPTLLTIAEGQVLEPGQEVESEWLDVTSFRLFKFYAHLTPYEGVLPTSLSANVRVRVLESPVGGEAMPRIRITPWDEDWWGTSSTAPEGWRAVTEFDGLYSKLLVKAVNDSDMQVTVSLYLLMAVE